MRAIINMASVRVIRAAGWRAHEIKINKAKTTLEDVFKAAPLKENRETLFDLVTDKNGFRNDFSLFISGEFFQGNVDLKRIIKDNEQIHLWDWPFAVRDS